MADAGPPTQNDDAKGGELNVVKVLSYNIHHGASRAEVLDLDAIAKVISESGAHLVGLQEVDCGYGARSKFVDQAQTLGTMLHMHVVFEPSLVLPPTVEGGPPRRYGNAILSRWRVAEHGVLALPSPASREEKRNLVHAAVVHPSGRAIMFLNTHTSFESSAIRLPQVTAMLELVQKQSSDTPIVLVGDFNAAPDAPEMQLLGKTLSDVWSTAGDGPATTFPATGIRIDYMLHSHHLHPIRATTIHSDASDHYALLGSFRIAHADDVLA